MWILRAGLAAGVSIFFLSGCTPPAETTGIGAATGGILGAGLGAIVGNQTGDPGAGMAIGAMAGASAGAAIGNALQAQQETLRSHDEAIERQQAIITAQRSEINELRRLRTDTGNFQQNSTWTGKAEATEAFNKDSLKTPERAPAADTQSDLFKFNAAEDPEARAGLNWEKTSKIESAKDSSPEKANSKNGILPQCREGFSEAMLAKKND